MSRSLLLPLLAAILLPVANLHGANIRTPNSAAPGTAYQVAWVTTGQRNATSANIEDYDSFVRIEANSSNFGPNQGIFWYAIASTALADARSHAPVLSPVYGLDGFQLAPNATTFYESATVPGPYYDRTGTLIDGNLNVWTGSEDHGNRLTGYTLGTATPMQGFTNGYNHLWLAAGIQNNPANARLYALSEPLTVIGSNQAVPSRWYTALPASQSNVSGQVGGGSTTVGGISFVLDQVGAGSSSFWGQSSELPKSDLSAILGATPYSQINFNVPTNTSRYWLLNFTGNVIGGGQFTFAYSQASLGDLNEGALQIYHYASSGGWQPLPVVSRNPGADTITVRTDSFSPFLLGTPIPEPCTLALLFISGATMAGFTSRRART
jgi:hypothetical protein